MQPIDRSVSARVHRTPDLFLSHSARDKDFVRQLAEDLAFCEVDVWLDEWELQPGDSLHDTIGQALTASRFVAIVLGDNFTDSRWASDEMKQALARERRENKIVVIPLVVGSIPLPVFLEDKLYIDFRSDYFAGVARLAAMVNDVPRQHIEEAIQAIHPKSIKGCIATLRDAGFEPYVVMSKEDSTVILRAGGMRYRDDRVRFSPEEVESNPQVSPRLRRMMRRLRDEVW
jgi:hypothetical protein